ncbi:MAG: glutamate--tRNA ligase [Gemmatimonadetes bacterium]|nr:glutamate--tRNA ligase [Gemmatimonadota bacterium]
MARLPRTLAGRIPPEEREARAAAGEPHAIRFRVPDGRTEWDDMVHGPTGFENAEIEDLVILRSDGSPTYNLAVVSDDADTAVTHVIRGDDHLSNTPKQILLYEALGKEVPHFGHVPMILGADGKRLSKRHGATAVEAYGAEGILPEAMANFLALLGWSPGDDRELFSLEDLVQAFSMKRVLKKGAVFDTDKLHWLNGQYLARIPAQDLIGPVREAVREEAGEVDLVELDEASALRMVEALKPRSRTLTEMAQQAVAFMERTPTYEEKALQKAWYRDPDGVASRLRAVRTTIETAEWTEEALENDLRGLAEELGVGAGKIFQPLRLALTGRAATPGIFDVLLILGRERSMDRLDKAIPMVMEKAEGVADS